MSKLKYDTSRFKQGHNWIHYKSEDNKFLEAQRNVGIDRLIIKVQKLVRQRQAKKLARELRKYKQLCLHALKDGSLAVVEAALKKGENLSFIMKEHKQLKRLCFKLKEEEELRIELAELAKLKSATDLDKLKNFVDRADNVGFDNDEMPRIKAMYEKASEIKSIQDTLLRALDSYVDIDSLRAALERAKELDEIPKELIAKAFLIFEKLEKEIELFRKVLSAFQTG